MIPVSFGMQTATKHCTKFVGHKKRTSRRQKISRLATLAVTYVTPYHNKRCNDWSIGKKGTYSGRIL